MSARFILWKGGLGLVDTGVPLVYEGLERTKESHRACLLLEKKRPSREKSFEKRREM